MKSRKRGEAGQALIEFTLTMTFVFIPILIGVGEFARAAYAYIEVANAARAAVQYGAQNHSTMVDNAGMLTAAQNDYSFNPGSLSLTPAPTMVCNCSDTGNSVTCNTSGTCTGAHVEVTLTVNTQSTVNPGFYEPFLSNTFTLQGTAVQKVLQ